MTTPRTAFLRAAIWHGDLREAEALLTAHPELLGVDIHTAAVAGDDVRVRGFLERDPSLIRQLSEPYGAEPLVYLCLSKYLRLEPARAPGFLRAAEALLDAGANPNAGFWLNGEFETALYGAAGVAHHPELTALLLARGADPNDVEVVYHSPEGRDSRAMQLVVETGRVTAESIRLMLIRKIDWHDEQGVAWLLQYRPELNGRRSLGWIPLHHAIERGNGVRIVALLLDSGADPLLREKGLTAVERAVHWGRGDLLAEFERRGIPLDLAGVDRLIAACARGDAARVRELAAAEPGLVPELLARGGAVLGAFATSCNTAGIRALLDLGIPVDARHDNESYFGIAKHSTALHVAAWMLDTETIRLLVERGADVNLRDGKALSPLALLARGCTESYWTEWRSTEPARILLDAGAAIDDVAIPTGYPELDSLLQGHSASAKEKSP